MSLHQELRQLEDQGIDLIEILGQDTYLRTPTELQAILDKLIRAGEDLYVELLHFLTHRRFPPAQAESLWNAMLKNKKELQEKLGRAVPFRVAAVDYLYARTGILKGVRIIARSEIDSLLSFVNVDEVTSVYNRRFFNERLASEIHRARRYGSPLSLLVIDLDNFKEVNDRYGHMEGDTALRQTGRLLRESTRQTDLVCRYGGDEFAVILPEATNSESYTLANRMRRAIGRLVIRPRVLDSDDDAPKAETILDPEEGSLTLSASIGGATFPTDCDEGEDLVRMADRLCLQAKRLGKDRICMSGEKPPAEP